MRILISGPDFYYYNDSIANGFNRLGLETKILEWPKFRCLKYNISNFIKRKLNIINNEREKLKFRYKYWGKKIIRYNELLKKWVCDYSPDITLILKGDIIYTKTLKEIKKHNNTFLVNWCYDSVSRYPSIIEGCEHYDLFYIFEPADKDIMESFDLKIKFLPMAYDPRYYKVMNGDKKTYDISFVGGMIEKRKKILGKIISEFPNKKYGIWGKAWTWYNPFLQYEYKIKRRKLGKRINNYKIKPNQVNRVYNDSKICLNIHHTQNKKGLNPRTFEILGAGGFQLVDYKEKLEEIFELGEELVAYTDKNDLLKKIDYYLDNEDERRKIAKKGHKKVIENHTFKKRAKRIIEDAKKMRSNNHI